MRVEVMNAITKLILSVSLIVVSDSFAESTIAITDRYSCSRLGDGKLHTVRVTDSGFTVMKNGAAEKDYSKELKRIATRIDLLDEYKIKLEDGVDPQQIKKLLTLVKTGDIDPDLTTREKAIAAIKTAVAAANARRKTVKFYIKQINKCEKQKYPGIESIGAIVSPIYVRGTVSSSVGYLVSVPKPAGNSTSARLCLAYLDLFTPAGIPPEKVANAVTFSNSICAFNAALTGAGVIDCTSPVQKGFLSFYLRKISLFERSPEPSSDTVINSLAQLASIGGGLNISAAPINAASGSECEKLR